MVKLVMRNVDKSNYNIWLWYILSLFNDLLIDYKSRVDSFLVVAVLMQEKEVIIRYLKQVYLSET